MIKVFSSLPWQQVLCLRVFTETGRLADILSQLYICEILLMGGGGGGGGGGKKKNVDGSLMVEGEGGSKITKMLTLC